jgi:hypothetical protein
MYWAKKILVSISLYLTERTFVNTHDSLLLKFSRNGLVHLKKHLPLQSISMTNMSSMAEIPMAMLVVCGPSVSFVESTFLFLCINGVSFCRRYPWSRLGRETNLWQDSIHELWCKSFITLLQLMICLWSEFPGLQEKVWCQEVCCQISTCCEECCGSDWPEDSYLTQSFLNALVLKLLYVL